MIEKSPNVMQIFTFVDQCSWFFQALLRQAESAPEYTKTASDW